MTSETTKETLYGIARGDKIINGGHLRVEHAQIALGQANAQMTGLGLEPDLRLVEYDVETTIKTGRPRTYKEPTTEDTTPDGDATATAPQPE
ncbi:MAG: hypothetical protein JSS74_10490 [Actinobacteria bacterium]|nr:hypothetical protein [Actinomycetota bacterium]